jgi:hypothetical protein
MMRQRAQRTRRATAESRQEAAREIVSSANKPTDRLTDGPATALRDLKQQQHHQQQQPLDRSSSRGGWEDSSTWKREGMSTSHVPLLKYIT